MPRLRTSEQLVLVYFAYVAILSVFFGIGLTPWIFLGLIAAAVLALARTKWVLRDFAPLGYLLAAYREMNLFTPAVQHHRLEYAVVIWDRTLLNHFRMRAAIESLGPILPAFFEACYALVYLVGPVSVLLLFVTRHRDRIDRFLLAYLAGTLGAYALFPYFPSEPPRIVFPAGDLPHVMTAVRQFNLWILGGYGIHSSVFPSAHVSSAFSAAWGLLATIPERRSIGLLMAAYAACVAIATVYGRYHYMADSVAGVAVSLIAAAIARWQYMRHTSTN